MALYRFLFAPALLAVAVVAGSGARSGLARPAAAANVVSQVRPAAAPDPASALERAIAAENAARPAPRAERARPHPVR